MTTASVLRVIHDNLFPAARHVLQDRPEFPWHGGAGRPHSSQALAVSVFGTIQVLRCKDDVVSAWGSLFGVETTGPWQIGLEYVLPEGLLREPRPTQLDAVASSAGWLVAIECKFTEPGSSCSQIKEVETQSGERVVQCTGAYQPQMNPLTKAVANCALTAKGIGYWKRIPELLGYPADGIYDPCPFRGDWYQWMRNTVAAEALGSASGRRAAVAVVYADGPFPMARKVAARGHDRSHKNRNGWNEFVELTSDRPVSIRAISYQWLLQAAVSACHQDDRQLLTELQHWVIERIDKVAESRSSSRSVEHHQV